MSDVQGPEARTLMHWVNQGRVFTMNTTVYDVVFVAAPSGMGALVIRHVSDAYPTERVGGKVDDLAARVVRDFGTVHVRLALEALGATVPR